MNKDAEVQGIEAEISFLQEEIDRRHQRVDDDVERQHNLAKIDELRAKRDDLDRRLRRLRAG
ncbi:MAG: hypothetical protein AAGG65_06855 [Pseudomonadota bacterium]